MITDDTLPIYVGLVILALVLLVFPKKRRRGKSLNAKQSNRKWRMKQADAMLYDFWNDRDQSPSMIFKRLRAMDPLAFEELILSALHKHGHKIKRSTSYSGDGGIDGKTTINGKTFLCQMKRYQQHITASHVADFSKVCRQHKKSGLFIHTGKTGSKSRSHANEDQNLHIISGNKLIALVTGTPLNFEPFK